MADENLNIDAEPPQARFIVFDRTGSRSVAVVHLQGKADGHVDLSISGDTPQANEIQAAVLEATESAATIGEPLNTRVTRLHQAISDRLRRYGYSLRNLPVGDVTLKVEFDLKSGRLIASQQALHDFVSPDPDLGRRLHSALASAFHEGPAKLAATVREHLGKGDHIGAAEAVKAIREGRASAVPPTADLLDALKGINPAQLDAESREFVRLCRMAVAAGIARYDSAEQDAAALLDERPGMEDSQRAHLENVIAVASVRRGEIETALSIWRRLTKLPELLEPEDRGWVWRNLSMALAPRNAEAVRAARLSVDAFLEAGDKREAATSLMHLSRLLEYVNPGDAIKQLDAMLEVMTQEGLLGAELRAAIYHARGSRLSEFRNHERALMDALEAVNLRRGVVGAEEQLISSLYLAAIQARALGDEGRAADFDREAKGLEDQITSPHFRLARRIENLFKNFDRKEAEAILEEVKGLKNHDLLAGAGVAAAMTDPDLTTTARLRQLEALLLELERRGASAGSKQPVQLAIATVLRDDRQYDRAVSWLRRILERHPLAQSARDLLVDTLWRASDWGGAAIFLKAQIDLHGARPGLMTAYGRSLLEAGDLSGAVTVLTKALKLIDHTSQQRDAIEQLRERALDLGGTLWPAEPAQSVSTPVVRDDVERALKDFATFLAADKRMGFWKKKGNSDYEWVPRPELRAQDLLHTFLKARFHERISVFEEFAAGAGRLDLLLRFEGGLSVIIELKMCGFGYSSAYASSGEEQIRHYMENRSVHLGYLVVHDARLDDFGTSVIQASETGIDTVVELFVDVRPRVSSRRSQA